MSVRPTPRRTSRRARLALLVGLGAGLVPCAQAARTPGTLHLPAAFQPAPIQPIQALPPQESGSLLPPVPMEGLAPARDCQTALPVFGHPDYQYWPPQGTMSLTNDGGWCILQFGQVFRAAPILPEPSVVEPPAHGELVVRKMTDRIGIAYRPAPGFTGSDRFSVHTDGPLPHTIPVTVTVR